MGDIIYEFKQKRNPDDYFLISQSNCYLLI